MYLIKNLRVVDIKTVQLTVLFCKKGKSNDRLVHYFEKKYTPNSIHHHIHIIRRILLKIVG